MKLFVFCVVAIILTFCFSFLLAQLCRTYCEEIARNVSTRKRKEIVQLDVVVTNKLARLRRQGDE